jgi:phage tail-like protein
MSHNFRVTISPAVGGPIPADIGFSAVSGLEGSVSVINYREGNSLLRSSQSHRGLENPSAVVLSRGVSDSSNEAANVSLMEWFNTVSELDSKTQDTLAEVSIIAFDRDGKQSIEYVLSNAWPSKISYSNLTASSSSIMINSLELSHDGIKFK